MEATLIRGEEEEKVEKEDLKIKEKTEQEKRKKQKKKQKKVYIVIDCCDKFLMQIIHFRTTSNKNLKKIKRYINYLPHI